MTHGWGCRGSLSLLLTTMLLTAPFNAISKTVFTDEETTSLNIEGARVCISLAGPCQKTDKKASIINEGFGPEATGA